MARTPRPVGPSPALTNEACCEAPKTTGYVSVHGVNQCGEEVREVIMTPINPLRKVFRAQRVFMQNFPHLCRPIDYNRLELPENDQERLTALIDEISTCIAQEAAELRDWVPWKCWSQQLGNKNKSIIPWSPQHIEEMRIEVVDLLHFITQAALILGLDEETLMERWQEKHDINIARQETGTY